MLKYSFLTNRKLPPLSYTYKRWKTPPATVNYCLVLKNRIIEIGLKIVIAALTAALTAITTTSCMGYGPVTL